MSIFQVICIVGIAMTATIMLVIFLISNEDAELSEFILTMTMTVLMTVAIIFMFMGAIRLIIWN